MGIINFQTGTFQFHVDPNFNYQLNRAVILSNGSIDEIQNIAAKIVDIPTWIKELQALADSAKKEHREENALAYIRAAEFFMNESNPNKETFYREYKELYYKVHDSLIVSNDIKRYNVPYDNGFLPVCCATPEKECLGIILIHGGFDSYMEDFLPLLIFYKQLGFSVYLFEGPGQGECRHTHNLPFTPDWHRPIGAVLDYFNLDNVALIGISLGSMLALRAAAYEKRIERVVAWTVMENFFDVILSTRPKAIRNVINMLIKTRAKGIINILASVMIQKEPYVAWGIEQGKYVFGKQSAYDFLTEIKKYNLKSISDSITQDVLILGAANDHFIPLSMYKEQIDCLTKARSLTFRIFTQKENAENHCNIGNMPLVLNTIAHWICPGGLDHD